MISSSEMSAAFDFVFTVPGGKGAVMQNTLISLMQDPVAVDEIEGPHLSSFLTTVWATLPQFFAANLDLDNLAESVVRPILAESTTFSGTC